MAMVTRRPSVERLRAQILHAMDRQPATFKIRHLATESGVHERTIYNLMAGKRIMPASLVAIAKALKMPGFRGGRRG